MSLFQTVLHYLEASLSSRELLLTARVSGLALRRGQQTRGLPSSAAQKPSVRAGGRGQGCGGAPDDRVLAEGGWASLWWLAPGQTAGPPEFQNPSSLLIMD